MESNNRQKALLAALLILLAVLSWTHLRPLLVDVAQGGLASFGSKDAAESRWLDTEVVDLQLAALEVEVRDYQPGRNLFRYAPKVVAPPPPPPPRREPPPPPPPTFTPPPPAGPKPPPVTFSLLGIFGPESRRIAVLTDDAGEILNVLENEEFQDEFVLEEIDLQWVYIGFVDFPDEPPVRLEIGS